MLTIIDIESDVFNTVSAQLKAKYKIIWVTGEATDIPSKFPAVTIVERSNSVVASMRTNRIENAVKVMYEVQVYSNRISDRYGSKKTEAEEISADIDEILASLNFTRQYREPISDLQNASIYRLVSRYTAIVDRNFVIYQS